MLDAFFMQSHQHRLYPGTMGAAIHFNFHASSILTLELRPTACSSLSPDLLARYGLMVKKLIVFEPAPQEVNDLRDLLNRLDVLEKNLSRELNRQEKAGNSLTFHRLEQQSITQSIKRHEAEIVSFKNAARDCVNASRWLQRSAELLSTIPGVGEKTALFMMVVLSSRQFQCAAEVASFLGLNPIEKRSGKSEYRKTRL